MHGKRLVRGDIRKEGKNDDDDEETHRMIENVP